MAWNALISGGLVQRDIVVGVTLCAMGAEVSSVAAPGSRHVLVMVGALVCTENFIRVDDVVESPKLAEDLTVPFRPGRAGVAIQVVNAA